MSRRLGITFPQVLMVGALLMLGCLLGLFFFPIFACGCGPPMKKAASAQNNRQMALAAIMYGADFDDRIPVLINGRLDRMQNIADGHLSVNAPAPGTQDLPAKDATGGKRTDAWPLLCMPYLKMRTLFVDPQREDTHKIFADLPKAVSDKDYDPEGGTYRNQNRFPMYGMNYMFLAPLRIPKQHLNDPNAVNYTISESHKFAEADDPSQTVFFTESQRSESDQSRGFFVINAPGMWPGFANNKKGYVAFWTGMPGSGDWVGDLHPCTDKDAKGCRVGEANFIYFGERGGCNATFLDGHVKYYRDAALAAGTDYLTAKAGADGSGAHIIDKKKYLWNLDNNFYGQ